MTLSKIKRLALATTFAGVLGASSPAWAQRPAQPAPAQPAPAAEPSPAETGAQPAPPPEGPAPGEAQAKPAGPAPESRVRPAPPKPPVVHRITTPIIVSGAIAGVSLVTGAVFAISAASENSSYKDQPNHEVALSGERSAFIADVSFGMAALFGLTALALYFLPDEEPAPAPSARVNHGPRLSSALKGELLRF